MRRSFIFSVAFCIITILFVMTGPGTAFAASYPSFTQTVSKSSITHAAQETLPLTLDLRRSTYNLTDAATLHKILVTKLARLKRRPTSIVHVSSLTSNPVLFVHGISSENATDCIEWYPAKSFLRSQGWTGTLTAISFYTQDPNCDATIMDEAPNCTSYHDSGQNDGTNNEDMRHVACEFAWFIWDHYTQFGQNVQVVAHSMGGLLVRWALYATPLEPAFPPFILVRDVVTMGTPHLGAPHAYSLLYCKNCIQGDQIETPAPFMQELINFGQNPQGNAGTDWTMLGSTCDVANVFDRSNTEWMVSGHKILFQMPCYDHGSYIVDVSTSLDASVKICNFCGAPPVIYSPKTHAPHSLGEMYLGLLHHTNA